MTVRQPLVHVGGYASMLPAGDVLAGTLATRSRQALTGTAGQVQFTVQGGYSLLGGMALLDVYINGVYVTEYTATDGSTFTLTDGLDSASDEVIVVPLFLNTIASSSAVSDPYFNNVTALLHMDTVSDTKGGSVTLSPPATLSTARSAFGGRSLLPGGGYLRDVQQSAFSIAGDFTAECFAYLDSNPSRDSCYLMKVAPISGDNYNFVLYLDSRNQVNCLLLLSNGSQQVISTSTQLDIGKFNHIAVARAGSTVRIFINGSVFASVSVSGVLVAGSSTLEIGGDSNFSGVSFPGYIDEVRMTSGVCRYTASFTPPTAAFPDQ